jgi:MobA/MobL family
LVCAGTRNLPAWASGNPYTYFQAAEQYERANGVAFEEWKITLPQELTVAQNVELVEALITAMAREELPVTYAFHNPKTLDGRGEQPHLHLLISARQTDGITRTAAQHFKRYNAEHPERGGAKKDPAMNVYHATKLHRLMIADMLNIHLEQHRHVARVHPGTLKSRGIEREAEPKLLPSESQAYRDKKLIGATMEAVLKIRESRGKTRTKEQNNAYQAWEERKAFLGITRDMTKDEKVSQALHERHGTPTKVAARYQPRRDYDEGGDLTDDALQKHWSVPILGNRVSKIYHLPTHANYGDIGPHNQVRFASEGEAMAAGYRRARNAYGVGSDKAMVASESRRAGRAATGAAQTRARSLAQQIAALTARLEGIEEDNGGQAVRVRLFEEERERDRAQDRGMGW